MRQCFTVAVVEACDWWHMFDFWAANADCRFGLFSQFHGFASCFWQKHRVVDDLFFATRAVAFSLCFERHIIFDFRLWIEGASACLVRRRCLLGFSQRGRD